MKPLALDYYRCVPSEYSRKCLDCRRLATREGQTYGPATPMMQNIPDEHCDKRADHEQQSI